MQKISLLPQTDKPTERQKAALFQNIQKNN